jgi:hypothetical protein
MYEITFFVCENSLWCASGEHIRVFDTESGKILQVLETKATKKVRCLLQYGDHQQVWAGSADNRLYVYDYDTKAYVKALKGHSIQP